jgi:hypothetical protein
MAFSITYNMQTGQGRRSSATAASALHEHAALLVAHANRIVVRDARNRIVTIADLVTQKGRDARYIRGNDGNSD